MSKQTTMFGVYIDKFFKGVIEKVTEKWNDKTKEPTLMFKTMLREEYSADLTWTASTLNHSIVAADVVSMDSSLPLKKRPTLRIASGEIAKIGIKYALKEKEISDINVMRAKGQTMAQIAAKILNNVPRVIKGIDTRIEIMFEKALSNGFVLVESPENDGTGVRASFGYDPAKLFHATSYAWSNANATPITDLRQMFDVEDNGIAEVYMRKSDFDNMRKTAEVKELVATDRNQIIISAATLPVPPRQATLDALAAEFGANFHIVNNSFRVEKPDGSFMTVTPWAEGSVVGVPSSIVGRLVYGTLAEDMNRVAGVTYQKSGNYALISEYSVNEPSLMEFTAGQALAMPVIDDGDSVFVLHCNETGSLTVDPASLSFTSAAGNKNVAVHADNDYTFSKSEDTDWLTVVKTRTGLKATVTANTGSGATARTASITVTDGTETKTISVSQSA